MYTLTSISIYLIYQTCTYKIWQMSLETTAICFFSIIFCILWISQSVVFFWKRKNIFFNDKTFNVALSGKGRYICGLCMCFSISFGFESFYICFLAVR